MPFPTWLLKARKVGSVRDRKRKGKLPTGGLPLFDKAMPSGIKGRGKYTLARACRLKRGPDTLDDSVFADGQYQVGNGNRHRLPAVIATFGTLRRYQLPENEEHSATPTPHPPRQQRDSGKRVQREAPCEPKCENVATRRLEELLQVAADTAASAELAINYVDESSKRAAGGDGIVAVVQAAAEASVLATRAAEQAYVALEQTADAAQKNHYQKRLRKAFHQTLVKSAIANYLAGRANQAVQAVKDAAAAGKDPADALADFITRQIHFMMVEYANYHPTPEEVAEIDALAETAKLVLEQTQNTALENPTQSEMRLIQTGNPTQSEGERSQTGNPTQNEGEHIQTDDPILSEGERIETVNLSQREAKLTKTGELTKTEVVLSQDGMGWKDAITVGMTIAAEGAIGLAGAFAAFGEGAAEAAAETAVTASEGAVHAAIEATAAIGESLGEMEALSGLEGGVAIEGALRMSRYGDGGVVEEISAAELRHVAGINEAAAGINAETGGNAALGKNAKDIAMRGKTTGDAAQAQHVAKVARSNVSKAKANLETAMLRSREARFAATDIAIQAANAKRVLKEYVGEARANEETAERLAQTKSLHNQAMRKLTALRRALGSVDEAEAAEVELREIVEQLNQKALTGTKEAAAVVRDEILDIAIQSGEQ
ncbi:hypothetical protein AAH678_15850 [Sodalis endosymbiont of Spalangia cameroni]|uniref:hypothetical protein n=1 Tax=Sodalis praecaptivus TaxID=1239307 RepID=UPI0031F74F90